MMHVIQVLDGYTDGRPSWRRASYLRLPDKATAEAELDKLRKLEPRRTYRLRKQRARKK